MPVTREVLVSRASVASKDGGAVGVPSVGERPLAHRGRALLDEAALGSDGVNGLEMATAERGDLAEFLATLTPEQWEVASLCEGWRVRDVVAHVMSFDDVTVFGMLRRAVHARFADVNQVGVDELASIETAELLDRLRARLRPQGLARTFRGRLALLDATIHHQDIRRPLGKPRAIPAERMRCVLHDAVLSPELPGWRLARGVSLRPTDLEWSHGSGPEVIGPAEAVLMTITGRASAVTELTGAGATVVAARLAR